MTLVTYVARLRELAEKEPGRPAVTCDGVTIGRAELESRANRLARDMAGRGVTTGAMVTIALPNSIEWFVAVVATWKLGATPQPVSHRLPPRELTAIIELARPALVVGVGSEQDLGAPSIPAGHVPPATLSDDPLPDARSPSWKAPTSGGSTGRPKLIVSGDPSELDDELDPPFGITPDGCVLVPGPLYHNSPIIWAAFGLLHGNHVVAMSKFDAEETLALAARYRADQMNLVPTMMKRIWRLPEDVRDQYDLSALRYVWHSAEPCPAWLKEAWIEWLGPDRILELYGSTESIAACAITGSEWLEHRGSVGRPVFGEVAVFGADGSAMPPGAPGEIWFRAPAGLMPYRYVGADARRREDGWESLGDNGYVDADGYVFLHDRAQDMILVGGRNVYPAEVEAALQEHTQVHSCAVIGMPDDDRGSSIHAIVEADPREVSEVELRAFLEERLLRYKHPHSYEFVTTPLRSDAGKLRRAQLRSERLAANVDHGQVEYARSTGQSGGPA